MVCEELLLRFKEMSREILGNNLTGIYLHGSAAMGCFHPEKSDLDLILVVEEAPSDSVKRRFMEETVRLNREAPAKGIELSIVRRVYCRPFVYPTPFELHFSQMHVKWFQDDPADYVEKMKGTDRDLAAHFTVINQYGITLYGEAAETVFGPVPPEDYIDSIRRDMENAEEDILSDPLYVTLNLCRVLAYLREGLVLSKEEGGRWGIRVLPAEYHPLILKALRSYGSGAEMTAGPEELSHFATYMTGEAGG